MAQLVKVEEVEVGFNYVMLNPFVFFKFYCLKKEIIRLNIMNIKLIKYKCNIIVNTLVNFFSCCLTKYTLENAHTHGFKCVVAMWSYLVWHR